MTWGSRRKKKKGDDVVKRFLKRRFLGIPLVAIVAIVVMATVALAAWAVINLTSTGTISVIHSPVGVSPTTLVFNDTVVETDAEFSIVSEPITITNNGEAMINGIAVDVDVTSVPAGLTATETIVGGYPLLTGESATLTVTLTGTAPSIPEVIELSGITATVTFS